MQPARNIKRCSIGELDGLGLLGPVVNDIASLALFVERNCGRPIGLNARVVLPKRRQSRDPLRRVDFRFTEFAFDFPGSAITLCCVRGVGQCKILVDNVAPSRQVLSVALKTGFVKTLVGGDQ